MSNIETLAVFIECSTTSTPTVETVKRYIDYVSAFGYQQIYLGVTDAYKIPGQPYFNYNRGGYTKEEFMDMDRYAEEHGMELRLNFQTLAHLAYIGKYDMYCGMMDTGETLMVGDDRTYEFIDSMFASLSESVRSRTIHIGMDEAHDLGLGQYLKKHGYHEKQELLLYHLNRVCEIGRQHGYKCEMWSDMFFRLVKGSDFLNTGVVPKDIKELIPEDVTLVHWMYEKQPEGVFERQLGDVKTLSDNVSFAGCAWKHLTSAPYNHYSIELMDEQMQICRKLDVARYMVTLWSDAGAFCSIYAVLPSLYAATELAKGKKIEEIDKKRFKEIVGLDYDCFMLLDRLNDPFFKTPDTVNNRGLWGMFLDLLIPSFDQYIPEGSNEAYAKLAQMYEGIDAGAFQAIFNNYINSSKVLSIKMELSVKIRKAYNENNLQLLEQYATVDIPQLIAYMKVYVEQFEEYWLSENMAYGLEIHHQYGGGLIARWESVARRVLNYVKNGVKIQELENEALPNHLTPWCYEATTSIDNCMEPNLRRVITFC